MSRPPEGVPWQLGTLSEVGLAAFCAGADDPAELQAWMRSVLDSGSVRPEWCFVALDSSGAVLGAHCWWGRPGSPRPSGVDQLWSVRTQAAVGLLERARRSLEVPEALAEVTAPLDAGASASIARPEAVAVLTGAGFAFEVARVRVEWTGGSPVAPARLELRPARSLADATLLALFMAVAEGSLDHGMTRRRQRLGAEGEARERLATVRSYRAEPDWFSVGFTAAGDAVGYVVPGWVDGTAVVGEIGVAAAYRGARYVDELLGWATSRLLEAGARRVIADTDRANAPMRAAFRRGGYAEYRWRDDYHWKR